jgi:release factor glutamine methyltransferase
VNLKQALAHTRGILADNDIDDASLEGEVLLRHILGIDRTRLFTELDRNLTPSEEEILSRLVERRLRGEPSAYITGHREFYGLDFHVDHNVLIPRPESEILVEKAINLARNRMIFTIADIGTGCGAIAISLALNLTAVKIYATDVSAVALEVARANCRKYGVENRIRLLQGNMLEPVPEPVDLIIANLPYVRESELSGSGPLSYEPVLALNGGPDGVSRINDLCQQLAGKLSCNGCVFIEIGQGQGETVSDMLGQAFPLAGIEMARDFAGIERVVSLCLTHD